MRYNQLTRSQDGIVGRATLELHMKIPCWIAAAVAAIAFVSLPESGALAQSAPNTGAETITGVPPAAAPAATTTTPAAAPAATTTTEPAKSPKKKKIAKMNRRQEIDTSIDRGTVPARYRNSVPKEYQQYVPFEKR
jgi:uncharacterized iron-regulated membrane protein